MPVKVTSTAEIAARIAARRARCDVKEEAACQSERLISAMEKKHRARRVVAEARRIAREEAAEDRLMILVAAGLERLAASRRANFVQRVLALANVD